MRREVRVSDHVSERRSQGPSNRAATPSAWCSDVVVGSLACRDSVTSLVGLLDAGIAVDGPASSSAAPAIPCARQDGDGCLVLGDGTTLFFSKSRCIPDPPAVSFAKDIPRLVRLRDDASPDWDPSNAVLCIQGKPVALKYWPEVYRYGKTGQWAGTKKNWAHWRVGGHALLCPLLTRAL
jgi:hypothetical protein